MSIDSGGNYSGTDLPAEDMIVTIETESVKAASKPQEYGGGKMKLSPGGDGAGNKGKSVVGTYKKIPEKYGNKNRSGLKANLTPGSNTANFDLTD